MTDIVTDTIRIYARIRPARVNKQIKPDAVSELPKYSVRMGVDADDTALDAQALLAEAEGRHTRRTRDELAFYVPRETLTGGAVQRERYAFTFDKVFDVEAQQDQIFDEVAKDVVKSALDGYNGTVFAYGQTGSGKSFTICGGTAKYADRGLIPRTLQFMFREISKRKDIKYTVQISYLEIYNECGYDLLDNSREATKLEDLTKVTLQEDDDGRIHLRNLSMHTAATEEEALNWLFVGDTNRMIAETPSNPASSRSHCLFMITVTARHESSDTIRQARLHLVDLAGSERVSRTQIGGSLLKEAKYINLSLHFLEQVIIALHDKALGKRQHIPYRNSMMTSVLRDSLGGNCMTRMIATIATEGPLIEESISTCRFAQRVSQIANSAKRNEEEDMALLVERLRREIAALKMALQLARGGNQEDDDSPVDEEDLERWKQLVRAFVMDREGAAVLPVGTERHVRLCFRLLKDWIWKENNAPIKEITTVSSPIQKPALLLPAAIANETSLERLQQQLAHRDNEINILVSLLRKKQNASLEEATKWEPTSKREMQFDAIVSPLKAPYTPDSNSTLLPTASLKRASPPKSEPSRFSATPTPSTQDSRFQQFLSHYPQAGLIEQQKRQLKQWYAEAKQLGSVATLQRDALQKCKAALEAHRTKMAVSQLTQSSDPNASLEDKTLCDKLTHCQTAYSQTLDRLRQLKKEIEYLQHGLEGERLRLQRAYQLWSDQEQSSNVKHSFELS